MYAEGLLPVSQVQAADVIRPRYPPMPRPRFQFRLSMLFWLTFGVACWFGGMRFERWRAEPERFVLAREARGFHRKPPAPFQAAPPKD